ncbi:hypothetical protein AYO21_04250 [Fonsecaea monophora]|uniref:BZIP domain-containing protein n=1 Tax=Fonsecaea monophora TaxID=254056 RepID=A0A177FBP4_9EURO|nr:hypothetical protein AYO21_04250 [Fonsecaea monophora]KAH0842745.1 hypothetical protein FOPE_07962 [Fonsecaea pedrosoi]OAG41548.1 hypothetical protein AYO21_04250 [Fonsecaea monophora]
MASLNESEGGTTAAAAGTRKRSSAATERRKLRNRLSQQAFRARQTLEINELKQQLALFSGSESDRNSRLVEENRKLKQLLWQSEKKLRSLQATLKGILDTMVESRENNFDAHTGGSGLDDDDEGLHSWTADLNMPAGLVDVEAPPAPPLNTALNPRACPAPESGVSSCTEMSATEMYAADRHAHTTVSSNDGSLPEDIDWDADAGVLALSTTTPPPAAPTVRRTPPQPSIHAPIYRNLQIMPRSNYSEHIHAYEMCAVTRYLGHRRNPDIISLNRMVSSLVSAFIKVAWCPMESWVQWTNGQDTLTKLAAWRVSPGPETFAAIPPAIQPTPLQTSVPHPPVIDWCVFPFLRDKLIQYHCADPALDEICGDIGMAYVVQADLSEFVLGAEPLAVYFNIHDIIFGMETNPAILSDADADNTNVNNTNTNNSTSTALIGPKPAVKLPAPDLYTLLHTKEYAHELYRRLKIGQGLEEYLLDPVLFAKYPHLYEPSVKIAQGVPLRSRNRNSWPVPRPLDDVAMSWYRSCLAA